MQSNQSKKRASSHDLPQSTGIQASWSQVLVTLTPLVTHAACCTYCLHHLLCHPLSTLSVMSLLSALCAVLLIARAMCCTTHPLCHVTLPVTLLRALKARRWRRGLDC